MFSVQFLSNLRSILIFQMNFLQSINLFSVQFLSNLWSVLIFQKNFWNHSIYSLYNFRGPAIDQSKFSKELGTLDRWHIRKCNIRQFLSFYTHLHSSFLVDSVSNTIRSRYEPPHNTYFLVMIHFFKNHFKKKKIITTILVRNFQFIHFMNKSTTIQTYTCPIF